MAFKKKNELEILHTLQQNERNYILHSYLQRVLIICS